MYHTRDYIPRDERHETLITVDELEHFFLTDPFYSNSLSFTEMERKISATAEQRHSSLEIFCYCSVKFAVVTESFVKLLLGV